MEESTRFSQAPAVVGEDAQYSREIHEGSMLLGWRELGLDEPEAEPNGKPSVPEPEPKGKPPGQYSGNGHGSAYARAALRDEIEIVARSSQPGRNSQLNKSAFSLGQFIPGGYLNRAEIEAELERAAIACQLDKDREGGGINGVRRTIRSGIEDGMKEPRVIPEAKPQPKRQAKAAKVEPEADPTADPREDEETVFDDETLRADHGNAARFLNAYRAVTRYVYARGKFMSYDGRQWSDDQNIVEDRANRIVRNLRNRKAKNLTDQKDKDAKCPNWLKFLNEIFNGDTELIAFIQRAVGYSLSGLTYEQVFFLLYGIGQNGKTTFCNVLKHLLAEYATSAQMKTFTAHNRAGNGHDEDLARLRGARLVTAIESEESKRLSEGLIKQITGGDPVSASYKNEHVFTFTPKREARARRESASAGFSRR